jgi:hypothetical protein
MRYETFLKNNPEIGIKVCPICEKRFIPTLQWIYKIKSEFYCSYKCYRQGGGANETKRNYTRENVNNKKRKGV